MTGHNELHLNPETLAEIIHGWLKDTTLSTRLGEVEVVDVVQLNNGGPRVFVVTIKSLDKTDKSSV